MAGCDCGDKVATQVETLHHEIARLFRAWSTPTEIFERRFGKQCGTTADANGNKVVSYPGPPAGRVWYIERLSKHASAGTPSLGLFVGPIDQTSEVYRQDFSRASADEVSDQTNPIYVE